MDMAERGEVDCAVIATTRQMNPELLKTVTQSEMKGVAIYDMPTLYEELTGKIPVKHIPRNWMSYTALRGVRGDLYIRIKQIFDVVLSALGLALALPLLVLVALAIKLDSRGPVFYRQKRVGLNGRQFDLIKLRSMTTGAESAGAKWAQENDTRITRIGRVLRKSRIDEIPQMWNVLKGEMSFIGPRPERPEFTIQLLNDIPFYSLRHSIKPGITGWAQVNYGYGASVEDAAEKLQYDLFYIKNLSFFLDLHILIRTIRVVLFGRGAR
jgi:exopolysaccharide biosynthesis polyprenyl glycosylphosphotransferase